MTFDLMKDKPKLDIPTLNYVWDWIWRMNAVNKATNEHKRGEQAARANILQLLEYMADREQES
jgi:hypothetical protein